MVALHEGRFLPGDGGSDLLTGLKGRRVLSLDALSEGQGVPRDRLPDVFSTRTTELLDICGRKDSYKYKQQIRVLMDFVYNAYAATRDIHNPSDPLFSFARTLDSHEKFVAEHAQGREDSVLINFGEEVRDFIGNIVHPRRIIVPRFVNTDFGIYGDQGNWIRVPNAGYNETFVDKSIVEEVEMLAGKTRGEGEVFHATNSAALEGIGKERAVLASTTILERGGQIKGGEYSLSKGEKKRTLSSVYASKSSVVGYSLIRWFNEYNITFGFDRKKVSEYLLQKGESIRDHTDDGLLLGSDVPLEFATRIFADHYQLKSAREWAQKNVPWVQVVSYEADFFAQHAG